MGWNMKDDSTCKKGRYTLCDFEIIGNYPDAQVEICTNCGKKVIYNKRDGLLDNRKYLKDHIRHTLQPHGRTRELFMKVYGQKAIDYEKQFHYKQKDTRTKDEVVRDIQKRLKTSYI